MCIDWPGSARRGLNSVGEEFGLNHLEFSDFHLVDGFVLVLGR